MLYYSNLVPSKAIPCEERSKCKDQPLQNILALWITVHDSENYISVLLKIPLSYYKTHFFLDFLLLVVELKGQVPAGISQLFSLLCCDRSKLTSRRFLEETKHASIKKLCQRNMMLSQSYSSNSIYLKEMLFNFKHLICHSGPNLVVTYLL